MIKDLCRILVVVNVNVINYVMLEEFEKWRAIPAKVGGVSVVLVRVAWMACLREWRDTMGGVDGVLV